MRMFPCGDPVQVCPDPEMVRQFLPYPLEASKVNPGGCILHMCSYVSRNENADHRFKDPKTMDIAVKATAEFLEL